MARFSSQLVHVFMVSAAIAIWNSSGCRPSAMAPQAVDSGGPAGSTAVAEPVVTSEPEAPFELEPDFRALTLQQFEAFGAEPGTWSESEGVWSCTGKPRGYLYSKEPFQNFTWRLEYRFPRPADLKDDSKFKGNTGFMVYITGEHKIWPVSLEVQGKHVQMAAIKENGGATAPTVQEDADMRAAARKPVGQWNALEIVSREGEITASLNGQKIAQSEPVFLSAGSIGIQAEDHPFEVRRMRIRIEP